LTRDFELLLQVFAVRIRAESKACDYHGHEQS
jgi:hypothetical protein